MQVANADLTYMDNCAHCHTRSSTGKVNVASTVKECISCANNRGTHYSHQKFLRLFPTNGPLESVAMDRIGPLPTTDKEHKHIVMMTDRYSKIGRVFPMYKITAPYCAAAFLDSCIIPYEIPNHLLTDNGPQFVAKFFESLCVILGFRHFTTTS